VKAGLIQRSTGVTFICKVRRLGNRGNVSARAGVVAKPRVDPRRKPPKARDDLSNQAGRARDRLVPVCRFSRPDTGRGTGYAEDPLPGVRPALSYLHDHADPQDQVNRFMRLR
jgi:hypothetical protein